jgi:hypothetical protein
LKVVKTERLLLIQQLGLVSMQMGLLLENRRRRIVLLFDDCHALREHSLSLFVCKLINDGSIMRDGEHVDDVFLKVFA